LNRNVAEAGGIFPDFNIFFENSPELSQDFP